MKAALLAALLALAGCAAAPARRMDTPPIPAALTQPCPPLTPLADGTGAAVLKKLVEVAGQYHECAAAKDALDTAVTR